MVANLPCNLNLPDAEEFLTIITEGWADLPEEAVIELRCLFPERTPLITRYSPDPMGIDLLIDDAAAATKIGLSCYPVINPVRASAPMRRNGKTSGATDEDIIAARFCWADGDDEAATYAIKNFAGPKYTFAVTTGRTPIVRPHIYWRLEEWVFDLDEWSQVQRGIAAQLSTDKSVVNPSRIMRLPGTINWPTKQKAAKGRVPELVTLRTEYEDEREPVPYERMRRVFLGSAPKAPQGAPDDPFAPLDPPAPLDRERARIQALSGQEWHNAVIRLVASYVSKGLSDDEIHGLTQPLTLAGYTPEETRQEVQTAIDGARRKGWTPQEYAKPDEDWSEPEQAPAPTEPPEVEWFDDIEAALTDSYLVKGVIARESMSVIYGPSNSGKTFFSLDMAYHIAIGATWRGHRVSQAAVLYLAAEGGRGVANRIVALKQEHGVCDVPLALKRAGLDLLHDQADLQTVYELARGVQARKPGLPLLIVIDTLSRVMAGGDENSAADMTALIRNIDAIRAATGAHVMLVHHTGKDTARGARGHSSLRAATDTEIEVQNSEDEEGAQHRAAMVTKQRDYSGGETFAFTLKTVLLGEDQDGDEVTSCVVETADAEEFRAAKKAKKGIGGNQKLVLEAFDQIAAEIGKPNPGGIGMPEPGAFICVPMDELRTASMGKFAAEQKRGAWRDAWKALSEDRGILKSSLDLVWRTDRKNRS